MVSRQVRRRALRWAAYSIAAAAILMAVGYALFWPASDMIASHDIGTVAGANRAAALQKAMDAARGRLLTLGAGIFAGGALMYTARNFRLSREGHVTDRYTQAIEQLGSSERDVRIGGIYALERVANDSSRDHPMVMEVLAAFIREHSPEQWPPPTNDEPRPMKWRAGWRPNWSAGPATYSKAASPRTSGAHVPKRMTRPDVQAALTVIGRRNPKYDSMWINLRAAVLPRANLIYANLTNVVLTDADLTDAKLSSADLSGAILIGTDFTRAVQIGADLSGAILVEANLTRTNLIGADLSRADLTRADFTDAKLILANLTREDLSVAGLSRVLFPSKDLTGEKLERLMNTDADFTDANLTRTKWPPDAVVPVPKGWQRDGDSGLLKQTGADSGRTMQDDTDLDSVATG